MGWGEWVVGVRENGWELGVREKLETVREQRERVTNRAAGERKESRGELHCNMAEECGAAEWRREIMGCKVFLPPSLPPSQAIAGLAWRVSEHKAGHNLLFQKYTLNLLCKTRIKLLYRRGQDCTTKIICEG